MATRFVRVDLSDDARDYRPIAVEPGVPMLDRSGANAKILFRWLGGMAGRTGLGGRLGRLLRPRRSGRAAGRGDLPAGLRAAICRTILQDDLAKLRDRLEQGRAGNAHRADVSQACSCGPLQELVDNPGRSDLDSYFFRYRDVRESLAAGLVLGLRAAGPGAGPVGRLHRSGLQVAVRPPSGQEPAVSRVARASLQLRPMRKTNRSVAAATAAGALAALVAGGVVG